MSKPPYTPQDVAEATGKGIATIYRHLRSGKLPSTKPGGEYIITRSDLVAYLGSEERVDEIFHSDRKAA